MKTPARLHHGGYTGRHTERRVPGPRRRTASPGTRHTTCVSHMCLYCAHHIVPPGYAPPLPHMQPATSGRLAGANSTHVPRHGPAVAAATERARTGSLAPLPRFNSHSWLSEHLHPPRDASQGPRHPPPAVPRPGRSPFDLDTQPLVDAFPIQPSASISVHDDPLQVRCWFSYALVV